VDDGLPNPDDRGRFRGAGLGPAPNLSPNGSERRESSAVQVAWAGGAARVRESPCAGMARSRPIAPISGRGQGLIRTR